MNKNLFFLLLLSPAFIFTAESGMPKDILPSDRASKSALSAEFLAPYSPHLHCSITAFYLDLKRFLPTAHDAQIEALVHKFATAKNHDLIGAAACATAGTACLAASATIPDINPVAFTAQICCCTCGITTLGVSMISHRKATSPATQAELADARATLSLLTGAKKDR